MPKDVKTRSELVEEFEATKRKVAELERLREGWTSCDQRLSSPVARALLDALAVAKIGVSVVGLDHRIKLRNRLLEEVYGDSSEQACYEGYMGREEPCDPCPMQAAVSTQTVQRAEMIDRHGRVLEVLSAPLTNSDGTVDCAIDVVRDITERKLVDQALSESEERFRVLFEHAADGILLLEIAENEVPLIRDANSAILKSLGYERDELIGQPVTVIDASPAPEEEVAERRRGVLSGTGVVFEVKHRRRDGTVLDFECSARELRIGSRTYAISVERDVTARKHAEEALRAEKQLADSIICTAQAIVLLLDPEGKIVFFNPYMSNLSGYDLRDVEGKDWFDTFVPARNRAKTRTQFGQAIVGVQTQGKVDSIIASNGRELLVEWYDKTLSGEDGETCGLLCVGHDVTERLLSDRHRQNLEEQLRTSQRMESIGLLAGGVAHDFNNLLTVILTSARFALESLRQEDPLRQDLEDIQAAGNRAATLTRQLLAFSRRQVINPSIITLNEVTLALAPMFTRLLGEDINLRLDLADDLWCVKIDRGQVEQVIVNLAINSRDAMPLGGKLTLETRNVVLDEEYASEHVAVAPGQYVMLAVSDTGIGMDEETRSHAFEPFYTSKEKGRGTGLGLATVYGIVKQAGGNVWIYSEPGQGTTVKIYLPRVDGGDGPARDSALPKSIYARAGETILVVEDEGAVLRSTRRVLEQFGYVVLEARDGQEAVMVSRSHDGRIDLVLTDVVMPGPSGRETAEKVLAERPTSKVLYMSGYTDNAIVHHGVLEAGIQFIEKPFSPESLARKVREVLDE